MRKRPKNVLMRPALVLAGLVALVAGLSGCKDKKKGTLAVRWKVASPNLMDPDPCATAGITHVQVQIHRNGQPDQPPVASEELACNVRVVQFRLTEGLYDITLYRRTATSIEAVATQNGVEVLSGTVRDWAGAFPPYPEDANDINVPWCGNGRIEQSETCDDGGGNSDNTPGACRTNCTEPFCGDGLADPDEECDASDLASTTCADLGLIGSSPGCFSDCTFDLTPCLEPRKAITLMWSVTTYDATPSDCTSESIEQVHYQVKLSDRPEVVAEGYAPCADGMVVTDEIDFGIYDIYLRGLGDQLQLEAAGQLTQHDHTDFMDTTASLTLRALP